VEVERQQASYSLLAGPALEIVHHGERATVAPEGPLVRTIAPLPTREPPSQPYGRTPTPRAARGGLDGRRG
jgi:alpha,alpha-trehalose phosphorylase